MKMLETAPSSSIGHSRSHQPTGKRVVKISGNQGPRMGTILMVADQIRKAEEYLSKYQLWRSLPKGMAYGRLEEILKYLESTNQITIDKDGKILWILADNPKLQKLLTDTKSF
jgi:hypothetical protein